MSCVFVPLYRGKKKFHHLLLVLEVSSSIFQSVFSIHVLFGWIACYGLRPVYKEQQIYGVALEMHLKNELMQHIFPIHSLHYFSLISDGSLILGGPLSGEDRIELLRELEGV